MSMITIHVYTIREHLTKISVLSTGTFEDIVNSLLDDPTSQNGTVKCIVFDSRQYEIPKCNHIKLQDVGFIDNSKIVVWFDTQDKIGYITSHHFYSKSECGLIFSHPLNELLR